MEEALGSASNNKFEFVMKQFGIAVKEEEVTHLDDLDWLGVDSVLTYTRVGDKEYLIFGYDFSDATEAELSKHWKKELGFEIIARVHPIITQESIKNMTLIRGVYPEEGTLTLDSRVAGDYAVHFEVFEVRSSAIARQ